MSETTITSPAIRALDLTHPVAAFGPTPFPAMVAVHCPCPGQVQVRLGGEIHTLDTLAAIRLLRDLRNAVEMSAGWPPG